MRKIVFLLAIGVLSCTSEEGTLGTHSAALTDEQCNYYEEGGRVTICHRTGSFTNPVAKIVVSGSACLNAHADHPGDFIAVDGNCGPDACLADFSPCDGTPVCCDGLLCVDGACQSCAGVNCDDNNQCTEDTCYGGGFCAHSPVAAGTACDDGDSSTLHDTCNSRGSCQGGV